MHEFMNKYLIYKPFLLCVDSFRAPDNSFLRCINQCFCTWCHCFRSMCVHMFVCVYAFFPKLDYIFLKGGGLSLIPFTSSGLLSQGLDMRWMMINKNVYWLLSSQAAKARMLLLLSFPFSTSVLFYREA